MREIDEDMALKALQNEMEINFQVALKRNESLWEIKRGLIDKLYFLKVIGVITKEELDGEEEKIDKYYRKMVAKKKRLDKYFDVDAGF